MITNMIRVYVLISFYDENGLHKAGSVTLVKEEDFNPLYMKAIPAPPTVDAYTKEETNALLNTKQDTLTAGTGITITNNVISAEGGSGSVIDNIQLSGTGSYVQSMDINSDTYSFSTVDNVQPAYDSDILASVELNGNIYKLFYLDNFQCNNDGYVTSFDDGDSNNFAFCNVGNVDTDSEGKVKSMDINGSSAEFVSIENISTQGPNGEVDSMDINGTNYTFAAGGSGSVIENIEQNPNTNMVASMDIDSNAYDFVTALHELDETDILNPQDGDCLIFDRTNGVWKEGKPKAQKIKLILKSTQGTGTIRDIPTVGTSITLQIDIDHGGKMTDNMLTSGYDFMLYDTYDKAYFIVSSFSISNNEPKMIILDNYNTQNVHAFEVTVTARSGSGSNSPWTELTIKRTV